MSIMRQVGQGRFNKYMVGEIRAAEVEFKWCLRGKVED